MEIQNRLLRIIYSHQNRVLIASDVRGRVHKFDQDLNLIQSSPVVSYDRPVNAICTNEKYIFTKDRFGSIGKWDFDTLAPLDFYDGKWACDPSELFEGEVPSLSPNRGIACLNGKLYTCNAYNQIVVIDSETFELLEVRKSPSPTFIDCFCVENPEVHALSDVIGNLYIGNLERNEFPVHRKIDSSVVHGVVYDKRHDRFWTTQDGGLGDDRLVRTGVTTIGKDGNNFKEFKLSHEDNEFVAIDPEHRYVFAGGFNGKISVFDNTDEAFKLVTVIGPLEFQIIHAAVASRDQIYVLLQTGDVLRLNRNGDEVCRAKNHANCVWILEPHPSDQSLLYAGTDYGVALIEYRPGRHGSVKIGQLARHAHGFGIVKDVKPLPDGSYVAISRKGSVFKSQKCGTIQWHRQLLGVPRGAAINARYDRCLVSTDEGTVWEMDLDSGAVLDRIEIGSPSYACAYAPDGRRLATADKGPQIHVFAPDCDEILGTISGFKYRLKRLIRGSNRELFVTGPDGMFELDLENYSKKKAFGDQMVSTKENGVLCNGYLHVGGYGYQVATYRYDDGKITDLQETLPDFTKAFAARIPEDGVPMLLVGGRGGFICGYRVFQGVPQKMREFYLR